MSQRRSLTAFARQMRQDPTDAERCLWQVLRGNQRGCKFRRQTQVGTYIVDFACLSHGLVIEVDGQQHADNPYDDGRDQWLISQGFQVLRFTNASVLTEMDNVLAAIDQAISACGKTTQRTLSRSVVPAEP